MLFAEILLLIGDWCKARHLDRASAVNMHFAARQFTYVKTVL